jgi:steroid 5-alpha reductase family enzyme
LSNLSGSSLAGIFLFLFCIESIADEQHWRFQTTKHSLTAEQRASHPHPDIRIGFYRSDLFAISRHPNYFAEQSIWVVIYLFGCVGRGSLLNWTIIGRR